jgi:hypothetical protein
MRLSVPDASSFYSSIVWLAVKPNLMLIIIYFMAALLDRLGE